LELRLHHGSDVVVAQTVGHVVTVLHALLSFALCLNNVVIVQHLHHARLIPTQEDVRAFKAVSLGASLALPANRGPSAALDSAIAGRLEGGAIGLLGAAVIPQVAPVVCMVRVVRVARSFVVSKGDALVMSEMHRS
jgi:hypothetical protein